MSEYKMTQFSRCLNCFQEKGQENQCPHCGQSSADLSAAPHLLKPGTVLNDCYIIGAALGHRHFGATYLAYDLEARQTCVIKEYLPRDLIQRARGSQKIDVSNSRQKKLFEQGLAAFTEESMLLQKLPAQPGIARFQAFFRANQTAYRVMNRVEGRHLADFMRDHANGLSFALAIKILSPLLTALEQSHTLGLCHLNIHSGNIIVNEEGAATLVDFSQSGYRFAHASDTLAAFAREGFSAKEIYFQSETVTSPADVYSLAACLYLALTGEAPPDSLARIRQDTLKRPTRLGKLLPLETEAVLMKALAIRPDSRIQTIKEFTDLLLDSSQTDAPTEKLANQNVFVRVACGFCSSINEVLKTDLHSGTVACMACHRSLTSDDVLPAADLPIAPIELPENEPHAATTPEQLPGTHYQEVFTVVRCRVCENENEILKNDLHLGARCLACGTLLLTPEEADAEAATEEPPGVDAEPDYDPDLPTVDSLPEVDDLPPVDASPEHEDEIPTRDVLLERDADLPTVDSLPEEAADLPTVDSLPEEAAPESIAGERPSEINPEYPLEAQPAGPAAEPADATPGQESGTAEEPVAADDSGFAQGSIEEVPGETEITPEDPSDPAPVNDSAVEPQDLPLFKQPFLEPETAEESRPSPQPEKAAAPEEDGASDLPQEETQPSGDEPEAQAGEETHPGAEDKPLKEEAEILLEATESLMAEVEQVLREDVLTEPSGDKDESEPGKPILENGQAAVPGEVLEVEPENPFAEMEIETEDEQADEPPELAAEDEPAEPTLLAEEMDISPVVPEADISEEFSEFACPHCGEINNLRPSAVMEGAMCQHCNQPFLSVLPSEAEEIAEDRKSQRRKRRRSGERNKLLPIALLLTALALSAAGFGYYQWASGKKNKQIYQEQRSAGDRHFTSGDYQSALVSYRNALNIEPDDKYLHQQIDKSEELLQLLQVEQQTEQEQFKYFQMVSEADSLFDRGQLEKAKQSYQKTLQEFPEDFYSQSQLENIRSRNAKTASRPVRKPRPALYRLKTGGNFSEMISQVAPEGIVQLPPGIVEFSAPVEINKNLTIRGGGANQTILVYKGGDVALSVGKGNRLTVEGLSLEATGSQQTTLIHASSARIDLRDVLLKGTRAGGDSKLPGAAVYFSGSSQGSIEKCEFQKNNVAILIDDLSRPAISSNDLWANQAAIIIRGRARPTIKANRIRDNFGNGVEMFDKSQPVIQDNEIFGNRGNGLYFHTESYSGTVKSNTIRQNKEIGILLESTSQATIEANQVLQNQLGGIEYRHGSRGIVRNNTIKNNKVNGIKVVNEAHPKISENEIIENQGDGIEIRDKAKPTIDGNTIRKNAGDGISLLLTQDGGYIRNNISTGNQGYGISILKLPRPTLLNNTATGNYEGSIYEEDPLH